MCGAVLIAVLRPVFGSEPPKGPCVHLTVAASSQKEALVGGLAVDYGRGNPTVDGRCVDIEVTSKPSGGVVEALARGWDEAVDGPRPDVWAPASSSWMVILRQRLSRDGKPDLLPATAPSVAQSPQVIAMPRPMAEALGWPGAPIGWSDILGLARDPGGWARYGHPEWGPFRLGKTNPTLSTSGLNATIGAFFAATGLTGDLTEADLEDSRVLDFVRGVESSVVHYADTSVTFLENLRAADDRGDALRYVSAVTVQEKSVFDYNAGNPSGDPASAGDLAPPKVPLVAVYPKEGTLLADHPFAVLNAPWVDEPKRRVAAGLLRFLRADKQQARFRAAGFRSRDGEPGKALTPANGFLPSEPKVVLHQPLPAVLERIEGSWAALRKRARVLILIDVSGSMSAEVPGSGTTRLGLLQQAASQALAGFARDDEVGLWAFSSNLTPTSPYQEVMPLAPLGNRLDQFRQRIGDLTPRGGTALYTTLRAASRSLRTSFNPTRVNGIILLTDGRNEYPQDNDLDSVFREVGSPEDDQPVRVFPIAYSGDADRDVLERIASASGTTVADASDPNTIRRVFSAVIANF